MNNSKGVVGACRKCKDRHTGCEEDCICGKILEDMRVQKRKRETLIYNAKREQRQINSYQKESIAKNEKRKRGKKK